MDLQYTQYTHGVARWIKIKTETDGYKAETDGVQDRVQNRASNCPPGEGRELSSRIQEGRISGGRREGGIVTLDIAYLA